METQSTIGYEPSPYELIELDKKADQAMLDFFGFIDSKAIEMQPDFLDELALVAWLRFVSGTASGKTGKDSFRSAVRSVLPSVSHFHHDAREIARMMFYEVASRLSKTLWKNRREKEARQAAKPPKRRESRSKRCERLLAFAAAGAGRQVELCLHGMTSGASETPIAILPPQTKRPMSVPETRERNLTIPIVEHEVYAQCLRPLARQRDEEFMAHCVSDTLQTMFASETTVELAARAVAEDRGIVRRVREIVRRTNEFLDANPSYIKATR